MMPRTTDKLMLRARRAMVAHAFYRLESALTIALTILLAFFLPRPFPWWRWWYWAILGITAEALIVYTSLTDTRTGQQVVAALLRERFYPGAIKTRAYRDKVRQALVYRDQIEATLQAKRGQRDTLQALENRMEQAAFRLEETLTSLGTVYSQFQLLRARRMDGAGARHLSDDIHRQVQRLQDLLTSMDAVYQRTP